MGGFKIKKRIRRGRSSSLGMEDEIVSLCKKLSLSQEDSESGNRLLFLMWSCLLERKDSILLSAHEKFETGGPLQMFMWALGDLLDVQTYSDIVEKDTGESAPLQLFVIPIQMFVTPLLPGYELPQKVPEIDSLVKTLRSHGLIDEGPSVFLDPSLYNLSELGEKIWSEIFWVSRNVVKGDFPSGESFLPRKEETVILQDGLINVYSRFILGVVSCGELGDGEPFWERADLWSQDFSEKLSEVLSSEGAKFECMAIIPCNFLQALKVGERNYHMTHFGVRLREKIEGMDPSSLRVLIEPGELEGAPCVSTVVLSGELPILNYEWFYTPTPDGVEDFLEDLSQILKEFGIPEEIRVKNNPSGTLPSNLLN